MKLTVLADLVVQEAGQHLMGDTAALGLQLDKFWNLVQVCLGEYSRQIPIVKRMTLSTNKHTFPVPRPTHISEVIPTLIPAYGVSLPLDGDPTTVVFEYDSTTGEFATNSVMGPWSIVAYYDYTYTETFDTNNVLTEVDLPDITFRDLIFIKFVTAKFMMAIGRSRRAFTMQEMPTISDSNEMLADADKMMDDVNLYFEQMNDWSSAFTA